jgi:hypothetical protein
MAYGQEAYGKAVAPISSFGIKSVEAIDFGHLLVTFSQAIVVDQNVYDPSNYVITVRYGRARTIFVKKVTPSDLTFANTVLLTLKNGVIARGQYRLTVVRLTSVYGQSIEGTA